MFRTAALDAVGANRRAEDARWVLAQVKDSRLRSTDKLDLMGELLAHEETRDVAFDWLKQNYDELAKGAGIFAMTRLPSLPQHYCSAQKAQEVERLCGRRSHEQSAASCPFDRMLEGIRTCSALKKTKTAEIAAALK